MQCPACSGQLEEALYEGVKIHTCPSCKGNLLDENRLIEIEKACEQLLSREKGHTETRHYEGTRSCPACSIAMEKAKYGKYIPKTIDKCPQCHDIWLDRGELEDIQVAYEIYDENTNKVKRDLKPALTGFKCPKCGFAQHKEESCIKCGIFFEKYAAIQAEQVKLQISLEKELREPENPIPAKEIKVPGDLGTIGLIGFVRDEIKDIPGIGDKPAGGLRSFSSRIGYALSLGFKEKEILVFGLLQWVAIAIAYILWIQMLDWIPEEVWRSAAESNEGSVADLILFAWSFICVGVAAFPIGILTGCMGAAHFLHKQGRESTAAMCLKLVLPHSWSLWIFHWVDGWITVTQILERLPQKNRKRRVSRAVSEAIYYAWKLGISGVLPSIVSGNSLVKSAKNSIVFVRTDFKEVAKLRAGYSALCWIVGIGSYIGAVFFIGLADIVPRGEEIYSHIYTIYFWLAVPLLIAVAIVMLILRPIYVLALCDLYSDHLNKKDEKVTFPDNPPVSLSALIAFFILCLILAAVFFYGYELGIIDMLSTPYGEEYTPK